MKNKILCIALIFLALTMCLTNYNYDVYAYENVGTSAKGMVVLEGNTNTVLFGHNEHAQMPMASTTKIVTAILAIENCEDLDKKFLISENAIGIEGTSIYIKSGEELSMR